MRLLFYFGSAVLLAGCNNAVLQARAVDPRGEGLPGVAVRLEGTPFNALTNGRGEYRLRYQPDKKLIVHFSKTGYTPMTMSFDPNPDPHREKIPAVLWPLPESPGVYLLDENYEFTRATFETPVSIKRKPDKVEFQGTRRRDIQETFHRQPSVVLYRGYKIPKYGVKLNRLDEIEEQSENVSSKEKKTALVRGREIPVSYKRNDDPDAQLLQITYDGDLEPGAYAVHWGALDGDQTSTEPRIFCFRVVEKPAPTETVAEITTPNTKPGEAAKKPATAAAEEVSTNPEAEER